MNFGWLWVVVDKFWVIVGGCLHILGGCGWLWVIGIKSWVVVIKSWVVVDGCRWLWVVVGGCTVQYSPSYQIYQHSYFRAMAITWTSFFSWETWNSSPGQ